MVTPVPPFTLQQANAVIEGLWPLANAESWDAPGLLSGAVEAEVTSIHLAVDAVAETVDEALSLGADLLLVHHPLLLRGVTTVAETTYKGALLARLIRGGCALVAAHTNADIVENGVSAVIAQRLGLPDAVAIVPASGPSAVPGTGIGRVGTLAEPTTLGRLARQLAELLPATATGIRVAGAYDQPVSRIALCGGAGDSLLREPAVRGADVYITSDLRHHPASEAREQATLGTGPALIDVSHWASEWLWLDVAAAQLRSALPGVTVTVSDLRTDPWDFVVTQ
ncbi:Nif3-like dinuclear metal center hexameric protein [Subtercola boreus]|uniref:GTP cyclohydrolase 1 type 2 homolog n=1 Tax=Subtercola boreus TaxID=120213 RepID=A0A3E0VIK2_9MICO|nr:Nif3-like dinuclear metal center hexameric protein [Subtercola boreus]RFA09479.1 Nif3-like dinuclear metal center hexameric protein [Subtercola boreus]TQL53466.1 dinuclear metal center YbgI/SA1388 family protein [Subtercola boreus]